MTQSQDTPKQDGSTSWSIVEQFVEAKTAGRVCEDMVIVTSDFAAVIDGASDATGMVFDGRSGGRLAAETVVGAITDLEPDSTARQFADLASERLLQAVTVAIGDISDSVRWPAATVVCLSFSRNEIWRIGDCSFVVDGLAHNTSLRVNDAVYSFRAGINAALLASGTPLEEILANDPGGEIARSLTNIQQHLSNRSGPWGYGCVNGRAIPDDFLEVFALPEATSEVALTSDGYPDPCRSLADSESSLRLLLKADPAAIDELWSAGKRLQPGANSVDDRAYLRLHRNPS